MIVGDSGRGVDGGCMIGTDDSHSLDEPWHPAGGVFSYQ